MSSPSGQLVFTSKYTSAKSILIYRIICLSILGFTVISNRIIRILDGEPFSNFRFFSIQNLHFLFFWFLFVILWRNDSARYKKMSGWVRGAFLSYTLVVTTVYYLLLFESQLGGIEGFNDLVMHLVGTILFIIDFILTNDIKFKYSFSIQWLIYPLIYLGFSIIYYMSTGSPIYGFLEMEPLGEYLMWVAILFSVFFVFSFIWIFLSKFLVKSD